MVDVEVMAGDVSPGDDTPHGRGGEPACATCGRVFMPWVRECPRCGTALANDGATTSRSQSGSESTASGAGEGSAPNPVEAALAWIDIPVSSDEPVEVALLKHFMVRNNFAVTETRNHLSVRLDDIDRLIASVQVWAFDRDRLTDERTSDSLDATLRSLGYRVLQAAEKYRARSLELAGLDAAPATGPAGADVLDLR